MKNKPELKDTNLYLVICGDQPKGLGGKGHATMCFNIDVALKEKEAMEKSLYPCKGIFEINSLNIFGGVPLYLKS